LLRQIKPPPPKLGYKHYRDFTSRMPTFMGVSSLTWTAPTERSFFFCTVARQLPMRPRRAEYELGVPF
jgi:hypothetical protein